MGLAPTVDRTLLACLLQEVGDEIVRAGEKHGQESMAGPGHDQGKRLGILAEEVGEVSEEVEHLVRLNALTSSFGRVARATTYDNGDPVKLCEELNQVAAMAVAWRHAIVLSGQLPETVLVD